VRAVAMNPCALRVCSSRFCASIIAGDDASASHKELYAIFCAFTALQYAKYVRQKNSHVPETGGKKSAGSCV